MRYDKAFILAVALVFVFGCVKQPESINHENKHEANQENKHEAKQESQHTTESVERHAPEPAKPSISRQQMEKDLELQATLASPTTIQAGEHVSVQILLRNKSLDTSYTIVKPGDGSAVGWREPHVFYTATLETTDGVFKNVPKARYLRCGVFDSDWQKDAMVLKPGEGLPLWNWLDSPSRFLEFQEPGRVQLMVHYSYRGGISERGSSQAVTSGPLFGVPAFELVSIPVEFEVVRPLDLVLTVKAPMTANTTVTISDLFNIRLENRSMEPIDVSSPTTSADASLMFEIDGPFGGPPTLETQRNVYGEKITLKPSEGVSLLGNDSFANGLDGTWELPKAGTVKVRAKYYDSTRRNGPGIHSNWVEINAMESN
jgi:hypothetical protein